MIRRRLPDLLIIALLFALPLIMFWQQTVGGRTLLPAENLYQFEPYRSYREVVQAPEIPHNALVSDLILQNYQWKSFIRQSLAEGDIPLWNPYQFAGIPFLAAGQQSTLYPFSVLYYAMPLAAAYGWFTVVQLWLAGVFMYGFVRGLGIGRFGAAVSGVVYQLAAFFVVSAVFPMIIAAAVWLPLLLMMIEWIIQQQPALKRQPASIPWVVIGAGALGCNILAGHIEITYYTLLIMAYYAAARLLWEAWRRRSEHPLRFVLSRGAWLVALVTLGIGLGAVQFIPLFELASSNFRSGRSELAQILDWAHPLRDVIQFVMPNFYGSPAHHSYIDVFTWQSVPATVNALGQPISTIDWGIKNYVEGALYLGILPLALALYSLFDAWVARRQPHKPPHVALFAVLTAVSLTFMFGAPSYALLYYLLPGIDQLHSPFRWVFAVTLGTAVLAGFGADALERLHNNADTSSRLQSARRWAARVGLGLILAGGSIMALMWISRFLYPQLEPAIDRIFHALARAPEAFADARMFYSYQYTNVMMMGVFILCAGIVLRLASSAQAGLKAAGIPLWHAAAVGVIAIDLMAASWDFNPASDPALLEFKPPAVEWLQGQPGDWRYTTLEDPAQGPIMNANMGWRYGLHDIRGYESIIPRQYVDYMQEIAPQVQLDFNRIAPLYADDRYNYSGGYHRALDSPLLDLLNVRYVMTGKDTTIYFQEWKLAYEDEAVRIWENDSWVPRAYVLPQADATLFAAPSALAAPVKPLRVPASLTPAEITQQSSREKFVSVAIESPSWLVISESYFNGWRAYLRPRHGDASGPEQPLEVQRVQGNFQGVFLPEAGEWTVRLVYSLTSFQIGAFASFVSAVLLAFALGVWAWRLYAVSNLDEASGAARVARNSLAPILLNLFNRGLDFAFAAVMFRILDPAQAGLYQYAIVIFVWFDIFTNFGLNTFLTREVARERTRAAHYLFNTSIMRLALIIIGVLPLALFLTARQTLVSPPLDTQALLALGLLYLGLLPNSLSTGLSALYYAFERVEFPSAVSTLATVNKVVCGVAVLLLGYGIIGLAAVSIVTNLLTLLALAYGARRFLRPPVEGAVRPHTDWSLIRSMTGQSWPLMLNHFLATIFFQIDIVLIEYMHGSQMVAQYSIAYKWLSALNVIPAFFTMAMLPVMSRQAMEDPAALKRSYTLAVKLLVAVALPTAVLFTFLAYVLTIILGGTEYVPDGAVATQLMIWSIPIGWINSLTQYVLIALNLQRRITWTFVTAVTFNIAANLIFIPAYGYRAAALTTIASEAILWIVFGLLLAGAVGAVSWKKIVGQPLAAAGMMLGVMIVLWNAQPVIALLLGLLIYLAAMMRLRPFDEQELARLHPLLPDRLRKLAFRR